MARIGILGGTFNPPHIGHLVCARDAAHAVELDEVLLVPVAVPPHKELTDDPGAEHRVELCRRATADDGRLSVSTVEVERGGPSYTVDTLRTLHEDRPEDDLIFIAGGDMARSLAAWREPEAVLELASFAVAERAQATREDIVAGLHGLPSERISFFDMPRIDVSSSMIRRRVADNRSIRWLVPEAVAAYIDEHALYRSAVVAQ